MQSKYLAPLSCILFIFSYIYFLYAAKTYYDPEAEVNYFLEVAYATTATIILSLLPALVIWLFKRHSFMKFFYRSAIVFFSVGIVADLLAVYLIFWSSNQ